MIARLRLLRRIVGLFFFLLITLTFVSRVGTLSGGWTARLQIIPALLAVSLPVLILWIGLTLLFGRVYCSFFCPLGVLMDLAGRLSRWRRRDKAFRWQPSRPALRYTILAGVGVSLGLGFVLPAVFLDPYSGFGRMAVQLGGPVVVSLQNLLATVSAALSRPLLYRVDWPVFNPSAVIVAGVTLAVTVYLGWTHGRLYCNTVCPVGALLSVPSRVALFKIRFSGDDCNRCGNCERACKAACLNVAAGRIDASRCVACFNCLSACPRNAITYRARRSQSSRRLKHRGSETSRRSFLVAAVSGAAAVPALLQGCKPGDATASKVPRRTPLTPPGSLGRENLLRHCTGCHLCIAQCPARILTPALGDYGLRGFMMPTVRFERGFCNYNCTLCASVCPSGAIKPIVREQKQRTQIGLVAFSIERCIVHTHGTSCGACAEHCPTQAISMKPYRHGLTIPAVRAELCIGCGACEYSCPASPRRAMIVEGLAVHGRARQFEPEQPVTPRIEGFGF